MKSNRFSAPGSRVSQSGAALVIGLVVLLMLTLLGVSSMNMTSLELRIASNTKNKNVTFQTADSVNDGVFYNNTPPFNSRANGGVQNLAQSNINVQTSGTAMQITTNPSVTHQGQVFGAIPCGLAGFSFELSCVNFAINSVSNVNGGTASANVTQGIKVVAPAVDGAGLVN